MVALAWWRAHRPGRQIVTDITLDATFHAEQITNEWIRHTDIKAAVTLGFTGVLGTMTFNLVKSFQHGAFLFDVLVIVACLLLVATGALCGWTLTPRFTEKKKQRKRSNSAAPEVDVGAAGSRSAGAHRP